MTYYDAIAIRSGVGIFLSGLHWHFLLRGVATLCEHVIAIRRRLQG